MRPIMRKSLSCRARRAAGEPFGKFFHGHDMFQAFMVRGAFGVYLILNMNTSDTRGLEFAHTAHNVQWIPISCPGVRQHWQGNGLPTRRATST